MLKRLPCLAIALLAASCQPSPSGRRPTPPDEAAPASPTIGSLFTSHDESQRLRAQSLAGALEETLEQMNDVHMARVHLVLKDDAVLARAETVSSRAAILIVPERPPGPDPTVIKRFAAAAVPHLPMDRIEVHISPPKPPAKATAWVGPFEVTADTAPRLKITLSVLLCLAILLALCLIAAGLKLRGLRRGQRDGDGLDFKESSARR